MEPILSGAALLLAIFFTLSYAHGVRNYVRRGEQLTVQTVVIAFLFPTSILVVLALGLSWLHLFYLVPLSFVLGFLSLAFPFSLLRLPASLYGALITIGLRRDQSETGVLAEHRPHSAENSVVKHEELGVNWARKANPDQSRKTSMQGTLLEGLELESSSKLVLKLMEQVYQEQSWESPRERGEELGKAELKSLERYVLGAYHAQKNAVLAIAEKSEWKLTLPHMLANALSLRPGWRLETSDELKRVYSYNSKNMCYEVNAETNLESFMISTLFYEIWDIMKNESPAYLNKIMFAMETIVVDAIKKDIAL